MQIVKDLLKDRKKEVVSVTPMTVVFDALKIMGEKQIGSVMVIDEKGKVCGILSERDYARKVILMGRTSRDTLVNEIMTPFEKMFTVKPDTSVEDCMVLITGKRIRHLPVFDGNKFVGLVSIGDVVKSMLIARDSMIDHLSDYISGRYV